MRGGVGFASGQDDVGTLTRGDRGELTDQPTLAQPGVTDNPDEAAALSVEHVSQPIQLGIAAQHQSLVAAQHHPVGFHREELSCGHGPSTPLTATSSTDPSRVASSTRRAVESEHRTPPAGAAASMRCAIPTGWPTAVYLSWA